MNSKYLNCGVIFKTQKDHLGDDDEFRHVAYKINPEELPLLRRLFNPWRRLRKAYYCHTGFTHWFSAEEYNNEIKGLKTLGDVREYIRKQVEREVDNRNRLSQEKSLWDEQE